MIYVLVVILTQRRYCQGSQIVRFGGRGVDGVGWVKCYLTPSSMQEMWKQLEEALTFLIQIKILLVSVLPFLPSSLLLSQFVFVKPRLSAKLCDGVRGN